MSVKVVSGLAPPVASTLLHCKSGAAYVEFLLAFMPIFFFFLGTMQLALIFGARFVVQHGANRAARAAVVVLDDDPRYYDGEERNAVGGAQLTAGQLSDGLQRMGLGGLRTDFQPLSRRATIELAAAIPLVPLAPKRRGSAFVALAGHELDSAAAMTISQLEIELLDDNGVPVASYQPDSKVKVRVDYRLACAVPIASRVICQGGARVIHAEASLPNHGARYPYP